MSTASSAPPPGPSTPPARRSMWLVIAVAFFGVVIAVGAAIVLLNKGDSDDGSTVPPLTAAEKQAGAVRVTYPDRSLPDQPEVVTVDGQRITLFFGSVDESDGTVSATLGVVTPQSSPPGIRDDVTIAKGETAVVDGYAISLLDAFPTGDPKTEAADVSVTGSDGNG